MDGIDLTSTNSSSHRINSSSRSMIHPQLPPLATKTRGSYREEKLNELSQALTSGTPSQVWSQYVSATNLLGLTTIPLEIHQQVLRKCTPSFQELRTNSAFTVPPDPTSSPHHLEGRLQTVIRNIRAVGGSPSRLDYHFILEQFAAVGHYGGSMQVLKEMLYMNISPRGLTYFLCLQAIAHRLTLPEDAAIIGQRATQARKLLADIMTDMSLRKVLFTSVTVDLCARIMKDTGDIEGFENLLKVGYGIDMSNPDHLPLEALGMEIPSLSMKDVEPLNFFPLSTSGLNTIIDMYGRQRNVTKLVQAFEVLTTPLPVKSSNSTDPYPSSFDDDDDFGVFDMDTSPPLPSLVAPSASPNTTSLAYIIRHVCHANHIPLARHYFLLAIAYEKTADEATRIALASKPISEVAAPRVSVDGHMVTSVLGVANRNKRLSLIRWIQAQVSAIIESKQEALSFYTSFRAQNRRHGRTMSVGDDKAAAVGEEADASAPTQSNSEDALSMSFTTTETSEPFEPINLDTHILILKNDISDLTEMQGYIAWLLGKDSERVKDRLARRVWEGKTIYSKSTGGRRVISPEQWSKRVVYMMSKEAEAYSRARELDRQSGEEGEGLRRKSMHWKTREDFFTSRRS
ncbi:hypothetical protein L218DRAFT_954628 [Marasmius fiardii PR-910]|nr:hypothetical protein L218DRAFT_954628 [Marasmius fiardii PR-910]